MTEDTLKTRSSIVKLLNDAHNEVNARTGKMVYTLKEHYQVYSFRKQRHNNTHLRNIVIVVLIAIVITRITRRVNVYG